MLLTCNPDTQSKVTLLMLKILRDLVYTMLLCFLGFWYTKSCGILSSTVAVTLWRASLSSLKLELLIGDHQRLLDQKLFVPDKLPRTFCLGKAVKGPHSQHSVVRFQYPTNALWQDASRFSESLNTAPPKT